jgi:hypothetical protein
MISLVVIAIVFAWPVYSVDPLTTTPTMVPTEAVQQAEGTVQPAIIYAILAGVCLVLFILAEIIARMTFRSHLREASKKELEGEEEYDGATHEYRLQTYLLSIFQLNVGVFSEEGKLARIWHEVSTLHPYLALLKVEVNGPPTISLDEEADHPNDDEDAVDVFAIGEATNKRRLPTLSSGTWNRLVRSLRLMTMLSISGTLLGLLYFIQYPDVNQDSSMLCFDYRNQFDCEEHVVQFLDVTYLCKWYEDTAASHWRLQKSACSYNADQEFNLQVTVLAILLTAMTVAVMQWPLDVLFNSLLIAN